MKRINKIYLLSALGIFVFVFVVDTVNRSYSHRSGGKSVYQEVPEEKTEIPVEEVMIPDAEKGVTENISNPVNENITNVSTNKLSSEESQRNKVVEFERTELQNKVFQDTKEKLDDQVSKGNISREEADLRLRNLEKEIKNGKFLGGGRRFSK